MRITVNENKDKVCAVVVTYNRKNLLLECLEALHKQTRAVQGIYIIDNASTDGTPELLLEKGYIKELPPQNLKEPWESEFEISNLADKGLIKVHYVRMPKNEGGAGGFYEGVKRAYEKRYDWFWLMDDDTIAAPDALNKLLEARKRLETKKVQYSFLYSVVFWTDNKLHKMNLPSLYKDYNLIIDLYSEGLLPLRGASFVSLLIHRKIIENNGYPIKDFFIWNDDLEYTYRISKNVPGFWVLDSYVFHKTVKNYSSNEIIREQCWKFFYEIRNKLWILLYSNSLIKEEKIKFFLGLLRNTSNFLKICKIEALPFLVKGILKGLFDKPAIKN